MCFGMPGARFTKLDQAADALVKGNQHDGCEVCEHSSITRVPSPMFPRVAAYVDLTTNTTTENI